MVKEDMETLTVRPSFQKILPFIAAFGVLGCVGAWIIECFGDPQQRVTGWFVLIASVGTPLVILSLVPISFYFRLQPTGLQIHFLFVRSGFINWRLFERIERWDELSVRGLKRQYVAFAFRLGAPTPDKPALKSRLTMARTRQRTGGLYDLTIPVAFGIDTDKLVALLNDWRIRYST